MVHTGPLSYSTPIAKISSPLPYAAPRLAYAAPQAYAPAPVAYAAPHAYASAPVGYAAPQAYAPAPVAYAAHAAPVAYAAHAPVLAKSYAPAAYAHAPVAVKAIAGVDTDYDPNPSYSYAYDIQDVLTGDSKSQKESRQGDTVTGSYSLIEPDGTRRTVEYTADPHNGFNAVVHREPAHQKAIVAAPAPAAYHAPAPFSPYVRTHAAPLGQGYATYH